MANATRPMRRLTRGVLRIGLAAGLAGCSTVASLQQTFLGGQGGSLAPTRIDGFIGAVAADEPTAALAGREVLALGGTAADAAVAVGFTLAVTYPSRASLGAGGACLAYSPAKTGAGGGVPEAILFTPVASPNGTGGDRPAAVPMLARGLFALHARYGRRPFETLLAAAEQLARFGTPASRAFVQDLNLVSTPLLGDPNARAIFAPGGRLLTEGATLVQGDLGGTLSQIRVAGVGDLYQGTLARRFALAATQAGGNLAFADLRAALPKTLQPIVVPAGRDSVAFLPPPADGGLAAAVAFQALRSDPAATQAAADEATATAARSRQGGVTVEALLAHPVTGGTLPALPASTTFATLDRDGNAVTCAITMDNLFGTGRLAPGTGVVLAASPADTPLPLLSAAIAWNPNLSAFRAEVGGSGQNQAALAVALALNNALRRGEPTPVPNPGRATVIACAQYLPGAGGQCRWAVDPRSSGLAAGSN